MLNKIFFLAECHKNMGIGHLMRILSLAEVFPREDFVLAIGKNNPRIIEQLKDKKYNIEFLSEDKISYQADGLIKAIKSYNPRLIVADILEENYYLLEKISKLSCPLVVIDDFANKGLCGDIVINGNIFASILKDIYGEKFKTFLGPAYLLLRKEFYHYWKKERTIKDDVTNVFVTVGGNDRRNLMPIIMEACKKLSKDIEVIFLIGPNFRNLDMTSNAIDRDGFRLVSSFNNIADLMFEADIAISSGGSTLYELACVGTPALVVSQVEHQVKIAEMMDREGIVRNLGMGHKGMIDNLTKELNYLIEDKEKRKKMSGNGKKMVDGKGSFRLAEVLGHG